jgi:hypothetical protein
VALSWFCAGVPLACGVSLLLHMAQVYFQIKQLAVLTRDRGICPAGFQGLYLRACRVLQWRLAVHFQPRYGVGYRRPGGAWGRVTAALGSDGGKDHLKPPADRLKYAPFLICEY